MAEDPMSVLYWALKWFWRIFKAVACFLVMEVLVVLWFVVCCISKGGGGKVWDFMETVQGWFGFK